MPVATDRLVIRQVVKLLQCVRNVELNKIEKLINNGVPYLINYTEPKEGLAALHIAASANNESLINFLLELGAHPDVVDSRGRSAAMLAAQYGHLEALQLLLAASASMKLVDNEGKGILFYMMTPTERHSKCLDMVLDHGAEVNNVTKFGLPLIINVCQKADTLEDICLKLLDRGAEPNSVNALTGRTAVMAAAASGNARIVKELLEGGADPNATDNQQFTAVFEAAKGGFFDVLVVLAGFHANFDILDKKLNTPIHFAAIGGYARCCKYLTQRGSNAKLKNSDGFTPRMIAKEIGYREALKECKKAETLSGRLKGGRPPVEDWALTFYDWLQINKEALLVEFGNLDEGNTGTVPRDDFMDKVASRQGPLPTELHKQFFLIVDPTRTNTINYNDLMKGGKLIPKQFSLVAFESKKKKGKKAKKGKKSSIPFPICLGTDPERTANGTIPGGMVDKYEYFTDIVRFHRDDPPQLPTVDDSIWYLRQPEKSYIDIYEAIKNGDLKTLQNAFDNGVPVDVQNRYYKTPLMIACGHGNIDSVDFLLKLGAKINATDNFMWTPLHHAAHSGLVDVVDLLISHGANLELKTMNGATPLMKAVESSEYDVVKLLIERGAKVWAYDRLGHNVMEHAIDWADPKVYTYLYDYCEEHPQPLDDIKRKKEDRKKTIVPAKLIEEPTSDELVFTLDVTDLSDQNQLLNNELLRSYVTRRREIIEDIRFKPFHSEDDVRLTTEQLVKKNEIRRQRFGYEIDFPNFKPQFEQNVNRKMEQLDV